MQSTYRYIAESGLWAEEGWGTVNAAVRIQPRASDLPVRSGSLPVASISLGGTPRGAVVLLCGAGALPPDLIEVMNGLAEHGYESIAPDLTAGDERISDDSALDSVGALIGELARRGWSDEQIGVVGYGFGGRVALLSAIRFALGAAVSISPTSLAMTPSDSSEPLQTPWLGMFGEFDTETPPPQVRALEVSLRASTPVFAQLVTYPGVRAGFHRQASETVAHAAAFDCWQRVIEWLNARVAPRLTPYAEAWRARQLVG